MQEAIATEPAQPIPVIAPVPDPSISRQEAAKLLRFLAGCALISAVLFIMYHAGSNESDRDSDLERIQLWVQAGAQSLIAIGVAFGVYFISLALD